MLLFVDYSICLWVKLFSFVHEYFLADLCVLTICHFIECTTTAMTLLHHLFLLIVHFFGVFTWHLIIISMTKWCISPQLFDWNIFKRIAKSCRLMDAHNWASRWHLLNSHHTALFWISYWVNYVVGHVWFLRATWPKVWLVITWFNLHFSSRWSIMLHQRWLFKWLRLMKLWAWLLLVWISSWWQHWLAKLSTHFRCWLSSTWRSMILVTFLLIYHCI